MAGHEPIAVDGARPRNLDTAAFGGHRAARGEPARLVDVRGGRHLAAQDLAAADLQARMGNRNGFEKQACVGMARAPQNLAGGTDLDDGTEVHDGHAMAQVSHRADVVRDEQVGQAALRLEIRHEVQDLSPHRDVERRDRLVRDDDLRRHGERAGDGDALPLAPRKLMREA